MRRILSVIVVLGCLTSCASGRPAPPEHLGRTISVLPPNNRTGDALVVTGTSLIDRYVTHADRVTVADVLLSEARFQLQQNGFDVVDRQTVDNALKGRVPTSPGAAAQLAVLGQLKGLILYLEIRRWEPDAPMHTAFIIAGLTASLIDEATGKVVWQEQRRAAPVATPGELMVTSAYVTAARKVIREMLAPLHPDSPVPPKP
jgi:hypothetical protein